ncbi:efflux transporter outer membrane subunit [Amphibiibacter pelophylacis]|uniref:Efflux transporter outer membrane subunit n=1 Tax=Amphibiibacter pelophylacis TaxID=1799477 RepID=A0ACC6P255_9BURK
MSARRYSPLALAAASVVLLAGCASTGLPPVAQDQPSPPPAQWVDAAAASDGSGAQQQASDIPWRDYFQDPMLRTLIDTALAHNTDLRAALQNVQQAQLSLASSRVAQMPTLSGSASVAQSSSNNLGTPTGASLGVSAAYEVDLFGRLANQTQAASAQLLATTQAARTARISLIATVAQSWTALQSDEALLRLARDTVKSRQDTLRLTQLKLKQGVVSDVDVQQAQSLVTSAQLSVTQQERAVRLDRSALRLVLGRDLPESAARAAADPASQKTALLAPLKPGLPSSVLLQRPDIAQAEAQLRAADANIAAARASFFPSISLTATAGSASTSLRDLFDPVGWVWAFVPKLAVAIFDGGQRDIALKSQQVARNAAVTQYDKAIQTAFREVSDALTTDTSLQEQAQRQQQLLATSQAQLRLAQLRYNAGVTSFLELLDAQRSLSSAQQAIITTRLAQQQARITLYRVLGGGVR